MMYIVLVCAVSVVLAAVCWSLGNDVLALNKESTSATITVNDESDFGSVADQLKGNDIIKHKGLFKLFASLTGGKDKNRPGDLCGQLGHGLPGPAQQHVQQLRQPERKFP